MSVFSYLIDSFAIAVALSIDAMVVAFSQGLVFKKNRVRNSLILAFFLGFFQFLMPLAGWWLGNSVRSIFESVAHWLAFGIFALLGIKIIIDAFEKEKNSEQYNCEEVSNFPLKFLFAAAVATSIDAFGAGISFNFLHKPFFIPSVIIGVITLINTLIGFWSGNCFKNFKTKKY